MFLQVCVCPRGGVLHGGVLHPGGFSIRGGGVLHLGVGGSPSGGVSPSRGAFSIWGGFSIGGGLHPVNVRAVRILLECILVLDKHVLSLSILIGTYAVMITFSSY